MQLLSYCSMLIGSAAAFSMHSAVRPAAFQGRARPTVLAESPLADTVGPSVRVEGNTLKTWDLGDASTERVQIALTNTGRPIHTNIELWHTPSYVPTKFSVYSEDGALRPVTAVLETPKHPKTVAVYNTGSVDFPFDAAVANTGLGKAYESVKGQGTPELVQGGKISSYTFGTEVEAVQVYLKTDEKNMKAKIELTQGPNQVKQIIELYASVGYKNPFYCVIQTPGANNAIRVINQNTLEFPFDAYVMPFKIGAPEPAVQMGGGGF